VRLSHRLGSVVLSIAFLLSISTSKIPQITKIFVGPYKPLVKLSGIASFYANAFHGRMTANGEIFNMNSLTAAHKTLPFNTKLLVRNLENGNTVVVRINDRGPYIGKRILDLSLEAAKKLQTIKKGLQKVEIIIME